MTVASDSPASTVPLAFVSSQGREGSTVGLRYQPISHVISVEPDSTVKTGIEDGRAIISISDTGAGIADDVREKIFEPFFTTKEVGKGTGQGLAFARSIILEKHNGDIDLDTELGKGATFRICLPLETEELPEK